MFNPDEKELIQFVQDFAPQLPIEKRIRVYRGFAEFIEHKPLRDVFLQQAGILLEAELRCREFRFDFQKPGNHHHDGAHQ